MEMRIWQKKLLFLYHLTNLPDSALAKEVLKVQIKNGLPGLYKECSFFLNRFGIVDLTLYSKFQFKKLVKEKIRILNKEKILEQMKRKEYKKIDISVIEKELFNLKPYFKFLSVIDARLRVKIACRMTPTVRMNFQSDPKFTAALWACPGCKDSVSNEVIGCRDTQDHVLICPAYAAFRQGKDLSKDTELVKYFQNIIQHRLTS